jgi:hypothetical protein
MKAWIENGAVRDIAQGNPQENYHPDVAALYDTEVPNGTVGGATLVAGVWTNPPPPPPYVAPPYVEPPAPPEIRRITRLAFRNRFTRLEKIALELAGLDDPAMTTDQRTQAAALRADAADLAAATFVDLDRADTRAGVELLEAAGLLEVDRALEILDTPITELEKFVG